MREKRAKKKKIPLLTRARGGIRWSVDTKKGLQEGIMEMASLVIGQKDEEYVLLQ